MNKLITKIWAGIKKFKWLAVVIALVIAGGLFLSRTQAQKKDSQYTTYKVVKNDLVNTINASGKVSGEAKVSLRFQASGQLAWVGVKEGDWVEKWQAIASLNKKVLEKQLKQELIDYANQRYSVDEERKDNSVFSNAFDGFTMTDSVKYDLLRSQNTLDRTVLDVEISDIALKYATLITPIEGVVTVVETPYAGINITPAGSEFEIVNPNGLVFEANIDEVDIAKIALDTKAEIVLDAFPEKTYTGEITYIGFKSTVTSGGGTAFPIKIKLTDTDGLKVGMNGDITIITEKKEGVLTVPFEAVSEEGDKNYIFVLENNKPVKKTVEIGATSDTDYEITSGLNEGEEVITAGIKNTIR